jgi:hypothetical protein
MTAHAKNDGQRNRLEQLLTLSNRLCTAIAADIAALEKGDFAGLATTDPEIGRLCAIYGREVMALKGANGTKDAPPSLIAALKTSGQKLNHLLGQHEALVGCLRQASEGLIQTVAEEVDKTRKRGAPYSPVPKAKRDSSAGAIVYNKVI